MKTTITFMFLLAISVMLLWSQPPHAQANESTKIRTWTYQTYSRIVFDFKEKANYNQPVILGEGKFSIDFYDVTTTLPGDIKSKLINKIEFVYHESFLTVHINIPVEQFTVQTFALSNPFRVVCDIYKTPVPLKDETIKKSSETHDTPLIAIVPPVQVITDQTEKPTDVSVSETKHDPEITMDTQTVPESKQLSETHVAALATKTLDKNIDKNKKENIDKNKKEIKKETKKSLKSLSKGNIELNLEHLLDTSNSTNMTDKNIRPAETHEAFDKTYLEGIEQKLNDLSKKVTLLEQTISKNLMTENENAQNIKQLQDTVYLQDRAGKNGLHTFLLIVLSVFSAAIILLLFLVLSKKRRSKLADHRENNDTFFLKKTNPFSFDKRIKDEFDRIKEEFDGQKEP